MAVSGVGAIAADARTPHMKFRFLDTGFALGAGFGAVT